MASKPPPVEVVEIDSGSDDDDNVVITATKPPVQPTNLIPRVPSKPQSSAVTAASERRALECRSFWKAGGYSVGRSERAAPAHGQLEHARVHPKFLHSNATSHKWAFGAIAELLDNAVDEIQNGATFVKIDKIDIMKDTSPALLVQDDGGGMDPDGIRKCMSLGYSSKKSKTTIGQYGNGFKTSTMRLGADVIVFSRTNHARYSSILLLLITLFLWVFVGCANFFVRPSVADLFSLIIISFTTFFPGYSSLEHLSLSKSTQSVGLLSYTFLRKTGQDDVIVPMVDFDISGNWIEPIIYSSQDDWSSNLKTILDWSPFESKDVLLQQFEDIGEHGTKVIIYNLWLNDEGIYELSFDDDDEDIRLRDEASQGGQVKLNKKAVELQSHISYRYRFSLRAYASILYLRKFKNFNILLRGKPVKQFDIANELKIAQKLTYKPQVAFVKEVIVEITIGFVKEAPNLAVRGFNVYHKNRLIRPFWKVTGDGIGTGSGIVGVLEANFIEPAHDKQDFERSSLYVRLEARLKQIYSEYWRSHRHLFGHQPPGFTMQKDKNAKAEKQLPGHCINEKLNLDVTKVSVPCDTLQHTRNMQFGNSSDVSTPIEQYTNEFLVGSHEDTVTVDGGRSLSVEEIREENIGLFIKCEEQKKKETELKETVQELEKELEQAKRKCAQLAAHLETRKRQKLMKQQNVL